MSHICKICLKGFKYDYLLLKHYNRKNKCKPKILNLDENIKDDKNIVYNDNNNDNDNSDINIDNKNIDHKDYKDIINKIKNYEKKITNQYKKSIHDEKKCNFCDKEFGTKGNLKRHMDKTCDKRKTLIAEKDKLLYAKQIYEQCNTNLLNNNIKNTNKTDKNNTINYNNNNTINFNVNINNISDNNIKLNSFGKEDLSHISLDEYKKILTSYFHGFKDYIKKIHFDDRMPSNHNIYIKNINSKYAYVYDDNQWNIGIKDDIIDKLISRKKIMLDDKCDELYEAGLIKEKILESHGEFINNYNNGGVEPKKNLSNNVELLLYNYRNKVLDKKLDKLTIK